MKGPLLMLVLAVAAAAITGSVSLSKVNVQLESEIGPYAPLTTTATFGERVLLTMIDQVLSITLGWFIFTGITLLVIKAFRVNEGSWRTLFYVIGYTLITSVVVTLITGLLILPLPTVGLGWGIWNPTTPEMENVARQKIIEAYEPWFSSPTGQLLGFLPYLQQVWAAALAAIAIHSLLDVSWNKAVAISAIASVLTFLTRLAFYL